MKLKLDIFKRDNEFYGLPIEKQLVIAAERADKIIKLFNSSNDPKYIDFGRRMSNCCSNMVFGKELGTGRSKLLRYNHCNVTSCPICELMRTRRYMAEANAIEVLLRKRYSDSSYYFLTLTVMECDIADLKITIKCINEALKKLFKKSKDGELLIEKEGYIRFLHVTRNEYNKAAPHLHVILHVKSGAGFSRPELNQAWQECLGYANNYPNIDIKPISSETALSIVVRYCSTQLNKHHRLEHVEVPEAQDQSESKVWSLLKPGSSNNWFLQYQTQTFKMKFITRGGSFKNLLVDARSEYKQNKPTLKIEAKKTYSLAAITSYYKTKFPDLVNNN